MKQRHRNILVQLVYLVAAALAVISMAEMGLFDLSMLGRGARNTALLLKGLFPPNTAVLPVLLQAMLETLQIAYIGTIIGFVLALPAAVMAARNLFSPLVTAPLRFALVIIRTIPSLLWALIFTVALGLGPLAGTFAIAFYTLGYLGKLLYEAFEGVDPEVLEAVGSVGSNKIQLIRYALLPEASAQILSQLLFIFEYNVRASTILGFVGAGGIGFYIAGYLQLLQYRNLMTALILTLIVVLLIEQLSARIRRLFLPPSRSAA